MWGVTMGVVAALGLATKLTFVGLALAPVAALLPGALRGRKGGTAGACLAGYAAGLATAGGLQLLAWWWGSGPAVLDGLLGELESPLLPAGAVLAALQLLQLELVPLGMAAWGWWLVRRRGGNEVALWGGVAAAGMPLFAAHQGTFVGVARPAEPFVAALAGVAVVAGAESLRGRLAWARGRWRGLVFPLLVVLVALQPVWQSLRGLAGASVVDPQVVLRRLEAAGDDAVLAPPYYAALARKRLLFDYADWTVWGMRAAAGVEREVALSERAVERLQAGALPLVAVDFRIRYLPAVQRVLVQRYVVAGDDGDIPARGVTFFVPAP